MKGDFPFMDDWSSVAPSSALEFWRATFAKFAGAGLKALTSTFQRVMHSVLSPFPFAHAYVDDVAVASRTCGGLPAHVQHAQELVQTLAT